MQAMAMIQVEMGDIRGALVNLRHVYAARKKPRVKHRIVSLLDGEGLCQLTKKDFNAAVDVFSEAIVVDPLCGQLYAHR
jgi:hypothetical protein